MPTRHASAVWEGGLRGGKGSIDSQTGAIKGAYSFGSRFENAGGTNPEELLAAAEAACYAMALSGGLEKAGARPARIEAKADCTVEKVGDGFTITSIRLNVAVKASGITNDAFQAVVDATKSGCPVSRALTGVKIEVVGKLE